MRERSQESPRRSAILTSSAMDPGAHLPYDVGAVDLDGDLARAESRGDLLVQVPAHDPGHHLSFSP